MGKYQELIILTEQRSGSHLLKDLLNSHPNLMLAGEPFSKKNRIKKPKSISVDDYIGSVFSACAEKAAIQGKDTCGLTVGFILHFHQINDEAIIESLERRINLKFIFLFRKNQLARIVSHAIAKKRKVFTSTSAPLASEIPFIKIRPCVIENIIRKTLRQYGIMKKWVNFHERDWLQVDYEDICFSYDAAGKEIFSFLDLGHFILSTKLAKQNIKPIEKVLVNYFAVESYLAEKGLESYACN